MNRIILLVSLFLNLLFCCLSLNGQIRPSIHFTEDDGLPGSKVMDIIRDNKGIMWIATDNGIAKFDGDKFISVNNNNGLPLQMARAIVCGERDEIFVGLYQGGLAFIRNDSVIKIYHSKNKNDDLIRKLYYSHYYKRLLVGTDYGLLILKDSVLISVTYTTLPHSKAEVLSFTAHDSLIFFTVADQGIYKLFVKNEDPEKSYAIRISRDGPYASIISGDTIYSGSFNAIFRFDAKNPLIQYPGSKLDSSIFIWNFSPYKDGKFLIGGLGDQRFRGDVVLFDPLKNKFRSLPIEQNIQSVNSIFYDTISDVIWIGRDNGLTAVFESPITYSEMNSNEMILDIGFAGDSLLVLTERGVFYHYKGIMVPILTKEQVLNKINRGFTKNLLKLGQRPYIFDSRKFSELVSFVQNNKKLFISTQRGAISVPDMDTYLPFAVGTFCLINKKSAYSFVKYTPLKFFPSYKDSLEWIIPGGPGGNVYDINKIVESKDIFYCISSLHGLYAIKNNIVFNLSEENSSIDNDLTDIDKDNGGNIWCLSANGKLFEIDFSDSLIIKQEIDLKKAGLIGDNCKWIKFIGKYMLTGTNKGLNVIRYNVLNSEQPLFEHFYNSFNGYEFISAGSPLSNGKDKVYLHTANEVIVVDTNFNCSKNERIYVRDLLINGSQASLASITDKNIPYNNKQISFFFNTIKYPLNRNLKYRYKINDGDWVQSNQVVLQSLRPSNYSISMESVNSEDLSKSFSILTFTVRPPFWKSLWFIICSVISLSMILFLVMRMRINRIKIQQEEKTRQGIINSELQLRSLQIQMNPHFIFNALNSIQSFILDKNTEDSMKYLGELGSIIRTNLENASEEFIPLNSEADFLMKYIEIEKMRFKNNLFVDFRNNVNDTDVLIPPMLIQPIIENAIKHGIRNRTGIGKISIDLNQTENLITVIVEDNGVGREFAKTLPRIGPGGMGLKILSQRLDLLNVKFNTKVNNITFFDLYDNNNPLGTKVVINLMLKISE